MKTLRATLLALGSCALAATMFAPVYMKLGDIKGEAQDTKAKSGDHKDWIEIQSVNLDRNDVVAPRDPASGLATGKRQHKPITVTKPVDKATPMLAKAMADGKVFKEIEIGGPDGTYKLYNATIANVTPSSGSDRPMESISFNYEKIEMVPVKEKAARATSAAPAERAKKEKPEAKRAPN